MTEHLKKANNAEMFIGYIPVVHDGYIRILERYPEATVGILDREVVIESAPHLRKDIRALDPETAEKLLQGVGKTTVILGKIALEEALQYPVVMPDDDVTRHIIETHPDAQITVDNEFVMWNRDNSRETSAIIPDRVVEMDSDDPIIKLLSAEKAKSTNWWRHVGSVIVDRSGNISLAGHNGPMPNEHTSIMESDPRILAHKGEALDLSVDRHAESSLIARAAKNGVELDGSSIFVTTFPCPSCAKLIALSGIRSCYFVEGYAVLDGQRVLNDYDVEIVKVDVEIEHEDPKVLKPYPTKS